jgi:hypothetical protein
MAKSQNIHNSPAANSKNKAPDIRIRLMISGDLLPTLSVILSAAILPAILDPPITDEIPAATIAENPRSVTWLAMWAIILCRQ